jgi:hypothetical protein
LIASRIAMSFSLRVRFFDGTKRRFRGHRRKPLVQVAVKP